MENRTEIGKAIKNKLVDLDKSPNDFVWSKIEQDLDKKRRKRIMFLAIPSVITLVFFSSLFYFNYDFQDENPKHENQTQKNTKEISNPKSIQYPKLQTSGTTEITTVKKTKSVKLVKQSSKMVTSTNEYEEYEVIKRYKIIVKKEQITTKPVKSAGTKNGKKLTIKNPDFIIKNKKSITGTSKKHQVSKKTTTSKYISKKPIKNETPKNNIIPKDTIISKENIITFKEAIPKTDSIIKIDSLKSIKKTAPKREYVKREYEDKKSGNEAEFTVSVFYGPAIFGTLNNKSIINSSMDNLSKSHPITSHYGMYVKNMYGRIGFRAGFSKINLKISTQLNSDQFIPNYNNIELKSQENLNEKFANSNNVELLQKISYYELPMEFDYAIKKDNTKIGIDAFTGFSFLILDKNQLFLKSENISKQLIGEVKNISGVNFSYNLGIGISYKLTEKIALDINPLFKYYLSTFKEKGEAKPYSFSLQSGVSYKF